MRCLQRLGLALFGLALPVTTATGVWADPPAPCGCGEHHHHQQQQHHRHRLFGGRMCTDCQRAELQAQGVYIPPPPPIPVDFGGHGGAGCQQCQAGSAPGQAVVGGSAPGYAVVGGPMMGTEPAPIGAVSGRYAFAGQPIAGRPGTLDHSVMPSSIPPPSDPVAPSGHNRPHVIRHVFGLTFRSELREARMRKREEAHASIAYDPQYKVNDVPASMVYGRR